MKKLLVGLLALASLSVFANDTYWTPISNIGVGSKLIILSDIEIEPNIRKVQSKSGSCSIIMKESSNQRRVLRSGSELIIKETRLVDYIAKKYITNRYDKTDFYQRKELLYVDNNEIESISCSKKFRTPYKYNLSSVTLIQFKNDFDDMLQVELAEPKEI